MGMIIHTDEVAQSSTGEKKVPVKGYKGENKQLQKDREQESDKK